MVARQWACVQRSKSADLCDGMKVSRRESEARQTTKLALLGLSDGRMWLVIIGPRFIKWDGCEPLSCRKVLWHTRRKRPEIGCGSNKRSQLRLLHPPGSCLRTVRSSSYSTSASRSRRLFMLENRMRPRASTPPNASGSHRLMTRAACAMPANNNVGCVKLDRAISNAQNKASPLPYNKPLPDTKGRFAYRGLRLSASQKGVHQRRQTDRRAMASSAVQIQRTHYS